MVKLTPELVEGAVQCTNAIKDRELDLRGYKIPLLENLGATLDQFDTLELSDNEIRKLDGFPLLKRLKALVLHNNKIVRIAESLEQSVPNLDTIILTNNNLQEVRDIDPLSSLKKLEFLSLMKNPLTMKPNYRLYVIHKLPQLRILDFQCIRQKERDQAAAMFRGKKVTKVRAKATRTFTPGAALTGDKTRKTVTKEPVHIPPQPPVRAMKRQLPSTSSQDLQAIRDAIKKAKTLDEVERLNQMLSTGQFSGFAKQQSDAAAKEGTTEETGA